MLRNHAGAEIQSGDVFVKRRGAQEQAIMMLPRPDGTAFKQPYVRLHTGTMGSAYWTQRHHVGTIRSPYRYVGTVPRWFLDELLNGRDRP